MSKPEALSTIKELISDFEQNKSYYLSKEFLENHCEEKFIKPFIKALGWDIESKGIAGFLREVITQDRVKTGKTKKAPDYGFGLPGNDKRLFYLEAKAPSVKIKTDKDPAFQLRRYGRSGQTPVSILFNFAEFAVYDCTKKQSSSDTASFARNIYITYEQYIDNFDFIYNTFSREAVYSGSFHKYTQSDTQKKGNVTLDKDFVESLNEWRLKLAKNIAQNNLKYNEEEINHAVQLLLDRIIFLRFCEERDVEPMGQLLSVAGSAKVYKHLFDLFYVADDKYNSGLFHFKDGCITENIKIDDKTLKEIIEDLYPPQSDYAFSLFPVEILGNAYEQFLGKTIRITAGHNVKIEDKPEVRKAGGVYYTPQYIVDYIVQNTVGKLIEGKTPKEIEKIKIVDPACGSGSFLLGAYKYLLKYHQQYYYNKSPKSKELNEDGTLITTIKKQLLTNNIFGVDLDENAVEVSKLSLLLKCMEGETASTVKQQLTMHHTRVLPDMDKNIVNGNSLIGYDFRDGELELNRDKKFEDKIKRFDWKVTFPLVFKQGGFDVVIGNPPYVEFKQLDERIKNLIEPHYESARGKYDLFIPFIEKGIKLSKKGGLISFILPSMFTKRDYGHAIRRFIIHNTKIEQLVYFGDFQVFDNVTIFPFIFIFSNNATKANDRTSVTLFPTQKGLTHTIVDSSLKNVKADDYTKKYKIESKKLTENPWNISNDNTTALKSKLLNNKSTIPLKDITEYIFVGIQSGKDEVFFVDKKTIKENQLEKEIVFPIFRGRDILSYSTNWTGTYIIYPYDKKTNKVISEKDLKSNFPNIYNYLSDNRNLLKGRDYFDKSKKEWYELWCERAFHKFKQTKIVNAEIAPNNRFYLDNDGFLGNTKTFNTVLNKEWKEEYNYVLGLLNSSTLEFFHKQVSVPKAGGFFEYKTQFLNLYPIYKINPKNKSEVAKHDSIVKHVDHLLQLNTDLQKTTNTKETEAIKNKITHNENKIDELVYELYELTPEEILIIENT